MKLIVALGNHGRDYAATRHNAGWLVLEMFLDGKEVTPFVVQKKFLAEIAQGSYAGEQCLFVKPHTYMNRSGEAVQKVMHYYKIEPKDLLVLHDDIDLPEQTIRLKFSGSHGGQKGVKDIIEKLGTTQFRRIKIGIGRSPHVTHTPTDWVLSAFTKEQLAQLAAKLSEITEKINYFFKQ